MSCSEEAAAGRFVAVIADFREARGLVFRGFFDIFGFLIMQPYRAFW
jgi:hypothetical protein